MLLSVSVTRKHVDFNIISNSNLSTSCSSCIGFVINCDLTF